MRPVLWSFRRCPYAMRARLAVWSSGVEVELREILLRDKPEAFLAASPSGTVPCLEADRVIDESLDVMFWALEQHDPEGWLGSHSLEAIALCDGPFKTSLDRYKYHTRHGANPTEERDRAAQLLHDLYAQVVHSRCTPNAQGVTDFAVLPFVRQYAHVDQAWFYGQDWPEIIAWLDEFKSSERFAAIMQKYPVWSPEAAPIYVP